MYTVSCAILAAPKTEKRKKETIVRKRKTKEKKKYITNLNKSLW